MCLFLGVNISHYHPFYYHTFEFSIHVSEATANELRKFNKDNWLTPREDMITPKGKEPMQTYFVTVESSNTCETRSNISGYSDDDDSSSPHHSQIDSLPRPPGVKCEI